MIDLIISEISKKFKTNMINHVNNEGLIPLHVCLIYNNNESGEIFFLTINKLLEHGSDTYTYNSYGVNSFHLSAIIGDISLYILLKNKTKETNKEIHIDPESTKTISFLPRPYLYNSFIEKFNDKISNDFIVYMNNILENKLKDDNDNGLIQILSPESKIKVNKVKEKKSYIDIIYHYENNFLFYKNFGKIWTIRKTFKK